MSHIPEGTLHAYLDGQLSGHERVELEEHLAGCAECRDRLEEAGRLIADASGAMAELEPGAVQPPPWREIEERAAARAGARSGRPRLRPGLAWAATLVLAFSVGWLSHEYWPEWTRSLGSPNGDAASRTVAEPAPAREDERAAADAAVETQPAAERPSTGGGESFESEADAEAEEREAEPRQPPAEVPPAVDAPAEATEPAPRGRAQARRDEARAMAPEEAEGAMAQAEADALAPSAAAPARQLGIGNEARKISDPFFVVQPEEASTWLGIRLRTLPQLELERVEVGPGAAVEGGLAGLPAVRLTYRDAAGHELTLIQQLLAPGGSRLGDYAGPALYLDPDGRNAYRWFDSDGRMLILVGDVSGDSLRALADSVR